jgi:5'-3' exonuclease
MKVHLVDGTYELFRAFYGVKRTERAPDGRDVGATRQLMRSLLTLLAERDVSHVAAAYDTVIESFRNELFDGYKTGDGIDPDLWAQFPLAERATAALGIVVWGMVDFEADDAIAAGAAKYAADARVEQVVICSPDKDMSQCIRGDRIVARDRMRNTMRNAAGVIEKFGVPPASIPDWLALVGDSADGIPGIPRWGAKGAATVLMHYGHIEAIPDSADAWAIKVRGAASLAESLCAARQDALLYRTLATLRTDVPLAESLDDLAWRGADRALLEPLCRELGYEQLLEQVPRFR